MFFNENRFFSERKDKLISSMEDKEIEKEGLKAGINLFIEHIESACADRKSILDKTVAVLKKISVAMREGQMTESARDEYIKILKNNLAPLTKRIQEYKDTIKELIQRIATLDREIQRTGEKLASLMANPVYKVAVSRLEPEEIRRTFLYSRFTLPLSQTSPSLAEDRQSTSVEDAVEQYFSLKK